LCQFSGRAALGYAGMVGLIFSALVFWLLPVAGAGRAGTAIFAAAGLFWTLAAPMWLWLGVGSRNRALLPAAGLVVLVPAGLAAAFLPPSVLLALIALVWVADTAAYFAGRAFGRRKLAPSISPGKTWAGVGGAILATAAYAIICAVSIPSLANRVTGLMWLPYLAGAGVLCFVSVVGDLFESALKRQAGVKDSGMLLPGHGGILDRIDSATAALPVGAVLFHLILAT